MGAGARPPVLRGATTSPGGPWPRSGSTPRTPSRSSGGPGRSTSRSCTRSSPSTSSSTGCARPTGSTPATSPRCCRVATRRSWSATGPCGTWPTRPSASASPSCSTGSPTRSAARSSAAGGNASIWLTKFDDFLTEFGWRTEGIADINIPSWIEDQSSPLGQIRNFLGAEERHDFDAALAASHAERDEAIEVARSQLSGEALGGFNQLLEICSVANFAWWNEDHNYYIDLRSSIPVRRGALALEAAVDADRYDDGTFLFLPEFFQVLAATWRGRTCSRSPPPATSTTTTTRASGPPSPRSWAPCRTRSRTPSSSRSSACTTTTSRPWPPTGPPTCCPGSPRPQGPTPAGLG